MIYKFIEKEKQIINGKEMLVSDHLSTEMEVYKEDFLYSDNPRCCVKILCKETGSLQFICLTKKDLYHLIGALHLIQKEL
jgi:hypothetical protein